MNLNDESMNNILQCQTIVKAPLVGMVDKSYFDGTRLAAIAKFKIEMENFLLTGIAEDVGFIIKQEDWNLPYKILEDVREICPEVESCLLFWADRTNYDDKENDYEIYYPVTLEGERDAAQKYVVTKEAFNLFFFCKMYSLEGNMDQYYRMKSLRTVVPFISAPPPSVCRIRGDGQMKILTDVIEILQDINFEDGDKILVLGSASEEGVCAGMSYKILSYMTDKKVEVDLYDPQDMDMTYKIGTVTYNHYRKPYFFFSDKGNDKDYKLLFDDVWVQGEVRSWDQGNYYSQFPFYSIKWFPFSPDRCRVENSIIKKQRYFTPGGESRLVTHVPQILYRREDKLGKCLKCTWLKYILWKDYPIEFYDYIMKMHNYNCVTKEMRSWFGPEDDTGASKWYEISDMVLTGEWYTTPWDPILGHGILFINEQTVKGRKFVFSDRRNVRALLYNNSIVFVKECSGRCFTNRSDINDFMYSNYDESLDINLLIRRSQGVLSRSKYGDSSNQKIKTKMKTVQQVVKGRPRKENLVKVKHKPK